MIRNAGKASARHSGSSIVGREVRSRAKTTAPRRNRPFGRRIDRSRFGFGSHGLGVDQEVGGAASRFVPPAWKAVSETEPYGTPLDQADVVPLSKPSPKKGVHTVPSGAGAVSIPIALRAVAW